MGFVKKTIWCMTVFIITFITTWVIGTELFDVDNEFTSALIAIVTAGLATGLTEWMINKYFPFDPSKEVNI